MKISNDKIFTEFGDRQFFPMFVSKTFIHYGEIIMNIFLYVELTKISLILLFQPTCIFFIGKK